MLESYPSENALEYYQSPENVSEIYHSFISLANRLLEIQNYWIIGGD